LTWKRKLEELIVTHRHSVAIFLARLTPEWGRGVENVVTEQERDAGIEASQSGLG